MNKIMRRLRHAHYRFGVAGLLPLAVRRTQSAWLNFRGRPWSSSFFDEEFDKSHGTDTAGRIELAELCTVPTNTKGACYHYAPISRPAFAEVIGRLPINCPEYTFVDYGCGKGRPLLLAAEHGFRKIVGVEFSPELCEAARRNAEIFKESGYSDAEITVVCIDASTFQVPPGNCVLFFFNPFGEELMKKVVENIEVALREDERREIYLVYLSPQWHKVLDNLDFLHRYASSLWSPDWYIVYKASVRGVR